MCHSYVVTEVARGTPPNRRAIVAMLAELESTPLATPGEILELIERRSLYGRGCGFIGVSLLASAPLSDQTLIWTLDFGQESGVMFGRVVKPKQTQPGLFTPDLIAAYTYPLCA